MLSHEDISTAVSKVYSEGDETLKNAFYEFLVLKMDPTIKDSKIDPSVLVSQLREFRNAKFLNSPHFNNLFARVIFDVEKNNGRDMAAILIKYKGNKVGNLDEINQLLRLMLTSPIPKMQTGFNLFSAAPIVPVVTPQQDPMIEQMLPVVMRKPGLLENEELCRDVILLSKIRSGHFKTTYGMDLFLEYSVNPAIGTEKINQYLNVLEELQKRGFKKDVYDILMISATDLHTIGTFVLRMKDKFFAERYYKLLASLKNDLGEDKISALLKNDLQAVPDTMIALHQAHVMSKVDEQLAVISKAAKSQYVEVSAPIFSREAADHIDEVDDEAMIKHGEMTMSPRAVAEEQKVLAANRRGSQNASSGIATPGSPADGLFSPRRSEVNSGTATPSNPGGAATPSKPRLTK